MTPEFALRYTFPAAFSLLPEELDSPEARAMLLAIGLQESNFHNRLQIGGPARGFWQFEKGGGVAGVLSHPATTGLATAACRALNYPASPQVVYQALADNDVLACVFARLLLWTLPEYLAGRGNPSMGWTQYLRAWRPGTPRPESWPTYFARAWSLVEP